MENTPLRVAIIGGGISGLAVAYELGQRAIQQKREIKVSLFEKQSDLGGNAKTAVFSLGKKVGFDDGVNSPNLIRWADLGVNDINLNAYPNIKRVMHEIGYSPSDKHNLKELENTTCYFSTDGSVALTDDADLHYGVSNPEYCLQDLEEGKYEELRALINKRALEIIYGKDNPNPKASDPIVDLDTTVSVFFDNLIANPKTELAYLDSKNNNTLWYEDQEKKVKELITKLRDYVFYPRISAMYFANDLGPENMLLAAPFQYYLRQESVDGKPDRRYFNYGTQKWIEALRDYISDDLSSDYFTFNFHKLDAKVTVQDKQVVIDGIDNNTFDICVMATHADDALAALSYEYNLEQPLGHQAGLRNIEAETDRILSSISYTTSISVCHTFAGLLPPNRDLWRAYNVLIRKGESLKPYNMTYVCNRHQNDAEIDGRYNHANLPQFFVTLNPQTPIPDQYVLRQEHFENYTTELIEQLPKATKLHAQRLGSNANTTNAKGPKAIASFRHNLLNKRCFEAQRLLGEYHKQARQLFLSGGWSRGSGLHEDCWEQGMDIAQRILSDE